MTESSFLHLTKNRRRTAKKDLKKELKRKTRKIPFDLSYTKKVADPYNYD